MIFIELINVQRKKNKIYTAKNSFLYVQEGTTSKPLTDTPNRNVAKKYTALQETNTNTNKNKRTGGIPESAEMRNTIFQQYPNSLR